MQENKTIKTSIFDQSQILNQTFSTFYDKPTLIFVKTSTTNQKNTTICTMKILIISFPHYFDSQIPLYYCYAPKVCWDAQDRTSKGSGYIGKQSTTKLGYTCQKWSSQTPNTHSFAPEEWDDYYFFISTTYGTIINHDKL